jgi:hypothetical protein
MNAKFSAQSTSFRAFIRCSNRLLTTNSKGILIHAQTPVRVLVKRRKAIGIKIPPLSLVVFSTSTSATMAITILAPAPAVPYQTANNVDDDDDENGGVDLEGDSDMRPSKRARRGMDIVTPGETVTDDPQWMRYTSQCLRIQLFY